VKDSGGWMESDPEEPSGAVPVALEPEEWPTGAAELTIKLIPCSFRPEPRPRRNRPGQRRRWSRPRK
jgi:hypothetical protein